MSRLSEVSPVLERLLAVGVGLPPGRSEQAVAETHWVEMRDKVRLATDVHLPARVPAPVLVIRTPYGRKDNGLTVLGGAFAGAGYAVVAQDCRGTGDSEPDHWDYYVREPEDSIDLAEWIAAQPWCDGFIGGFGGSYAAQTAWCLAMHPKVAAIAPEVSGLGVAVNTTSLHMFLNAYARSVGRDADSEVGFDQLERDMHVETLAGGWYDAPFQAAIPEALLVRDPVLRTLSHRQAQRRLWETYCALSCADRADFLKIALGVDRISIETIEALPALFGRDISHDRHTLPSMDPGDRVGALRAPVLMVTGWYDWGLNDALATWDLIARVASPEVGRASRLIITPAAHLTPGYREGVEDRPELDRVFRSSKIADLLDHWFTTARAGAFETWPQVIYYLMGANEWRTAPAWPPPDTRPMRLYLGDGGLTAAAPPEAGSNGWTYDPQDPTPTAGGSIVSSVYPAGGVDVSAVQQRSDVLTFTTPELEHDLDVVGPIRMVLYASSSAPDTDFVARVSDVFPDGRAIQLQNGVLRARFRDLEEGPQRLQPGRIYRLEIDLWATANRFRAGHRLRVDLSSSDFPRFDRNANRPAVEGPPMVARQTAYYGGDRASHLLINVLRER